MNLGLRLLEKRDLPQYKADMQGAFQLGAQEGGCFAAGELVLPESDIDRSLGAEGAIAYRAVEGGQIVGGAIVVWDREKSWAIWTCSMSNTAPAASPRSMITSSRAATRPCGSTARSILATSTPTPARSVKKSCTANGRLHPA